MKREIIALVVFLVLFVSCGGSTKSRFYVPPGYNYSAEQIIFDDGTTLAQKLSGKKIITSWWDRLIFVSKAYAGSNEYIRASEVYFDDGSGGRSVQEVLETLTASIPLDATTLIIGTWTADSKNNYYEGLQVVFNADGTYQPTIAEGYHNPWGGGGGGSAMIIKDLFGLEKFAPSGSTCATPQYKYSVIGGRYLAYEYYEGNLCSTLRQMGSNIIMIDKDHMILEAAGRPIYLNRVTE